MPVPMLVCHCMAVHETRLRRVLAAGARDEFDVAEACGAGSVCGGCVPTISRLLDECRQCPTGAVAVAVDDELVHEVARPY